MQSSTAALLKGIGLTESEIKVYLALLELGSCSKGPIVDKSRVASSKVYELLDKLIEKGLASYVIKSGTKHFEAAPPSRILDYMKEKEKRLEEQQEELKKVIPLLESKRKSEEGAEVQVFRGIKGAKTAFQEILEVLSKGDEYYVMGVSEIKGNFRNFIMGFHKKRAAKGIKCKLLINELAKDLGKEYLKIKLTKVKYLQKELFNPFAFVIYKDNVIMTGSSEEIFIKIKSKSMSEGLKTYADYLWNQETRVSKGMEGMKEVLLKEVLEEVGPGETYDVMGAAFGEEGTRKVYQKFFRKMHRERIKRKIPARLIFQKGNEKYLEQYKELYKHSYSETRFLPYKLNSPVAVFSTKDKTRLLIQKKDPTIITIDNKDVAQSFKKQFETLWNQDVQIYDGYKEVTNKLTTSMKEMKEGEEYYVLGGTYGNQAKRLSTFFSKYHKERASRGVKVKILADRGHYPEVKKTLINAEHPHPLKLGQYKKIPIEQSSPMQTVLFPNNKVLMFLFGEKMQCFEINSEVVWNNFKNQFDNLWNQETRIAKGLDAVQELFEEMLEAGHCDFIGARGYFIDARPKFFESWKKRALKQGFSARNIVDKKVKGHDITKLPYMKTKYTLQKEFADLSVFWIYADKVCISNWAGKEPLVTIIENKQIQELYKKQFETLWNKN